MDDLVNSRRNFPYYRANSEAAKAAVENYLLKYEEFRGAQGERALSSKDRDNYSVHIELVVLDLLAAWEGDPSRYVGYSRKADYFRKGGGYWNQKDDRPILSERVFLNVIDFLTQSGLIANYVAAAGYSPMSSRMRASKELIDDLRGAGVNWTGVGLDPEAPVIFVKDENKNLVSFPDHDEFDLESAERNLRRITEVAKRGFNQAQIMMVSGHRDVRSVQRYTHLNVRDVIKLLD